MNGSAIKIRVKLSVDTALAQGTTRAGEDTVAMWEGKQFTYNVWF